MNKLRKCIVSLLVVIAVMLTLNLVVLGSRTAIAETAVAGRDPYIVKLLPRSATEYVRVWSDGQVDVLERQLGDGTCDFNIIVIDGPVDHPFPIVEVVEVSGGRLGAMMTFEDGRVDLVGPTGGVPRCTIAGIGTPSFCTADVDRDGEVGVKDLLTLLGQWGSCE